jgi:Mrp family chromosome partitioning ATPase
VIDAPPVLPVADPGILSGIVDGVVLVVRAGKTQRKIVQQAKALLRQAKAKLLGCVLTHAEYYIPGYYYRYANKGRGDAKAASLTLAASAAAPATATTSDEGAP